VYSSTKGVTSVCANRLIEQGRLDPDATVAQYWPEFAANGKAAITVRQALSHQAGLPYVEGDFTLDEALAWDPMVAAIAAQAPIWEPGTQHGYHMRTFGWIVGEIVRRIDGRTIGTFWRDQIADPLGLDFWIGLPEEIEPRVARLVPPQSDLGALLKEFGPDLLLTKVFSSPGEQFGYNEMWNTRALHACELPSSNGIGDARSLARMYAACIGAVDDVRALDDSTVTAATVEQACGKDAVLMAESCFGLGFMLGKSFGAANPPSAFGHAGAGGSLAFADPQAGLGFGYVMNDLRFDAKGDPRSEELVRAAYRSLER
jgi:CubicO group peptidase (beta-lactamase class C family)